jgi:hypothetical protein
MAFFLFVERQRRRQAKKTPKKSKRRAPEQVHALHVMSCPAFRDSPSAIKVLPLITFVITYLHLYMSTPNLSPP